MSYRSVDQIVRDELRTCIACHQIRPAQFGPNYARAVWVPAKRPPVPMGDADGLRQSAPKERKP